MGPGVSPLVELLTPEPQTGTGFRDGVLKEAAEIKRSYGGPI
jgi:hypothetical protein